MYNKVDWRSISDIDLSAGLLAPACVSCSVFVCDTVEKIMIRASILVQPRNSWVNSIFYRKLIEENGEVILLASFTLFADVLLYMYFPIS